MQSIQDKIEDINEDLSFLEDMDKLEYIVDIAKKSDGLDDTEKTEANKVFGCASATWVIVTIEDGVVSLRTDSEALTVKGMLVLLEKIINRHTIPEILELDEQELLSALGLGGSITNRRMNGFASAIVKIKADLAAIKKNQD